MSSISAGIDQCRTVYKTSRLRTQTISFQPSRMSALASFLSLALLLSSSSVGAIVSVSNTGPVVKLSYGSFQGNATGDIVEFLGMPFAAPPYVSCLIFTSIFINNYLKVLGISDLHLQHRLWSSLEFARPLVLERLVLSRQQISLFQALAQPPSVSL